MLLLDSSNIKEINKQIIDGFRSKNALTPETSIFLEELELKCELKLQLLLVEEFIRMDVIKVLSNGKMFFKNKKWKQTKVLFNIGYILLFLLPIILGLIFILI